MYEADELFYSYFRRVNKCRTREQLNSMFSYENLYINLKGFGLSSKDIDETDYCNLVIAVKNIWNEVKGNI